MMRSGIVAALAAAIGCTAGCTTSDTSTSVVAPSADKCQVNVSNSPASFPSSGGSGTVTVNAPRDCTWSAATGTAWVTITGSRSGQGDASVPYSVAPNPTAAARSGSLSIGSMSVPLSQDGAPCRFSINRSADSIGSDGGRLSVDVSTLAGCSWTAASGANWIAIVSGANGSASGTVSLSVAANSGAARVGQLNVAGQNYTVNQAGAPTPPAPKPPAPAPDPSPSPSPSPAPSPAPAPAPAPAPPSSQRVTFSGVVFAVSGKCPALTMNVSGRTVTTDNETKFNDVKCDKIRVGTGLNVDGTMDASGVVNADVVQGTGGGE